MASDILFGIFLQLRRIALQFATYCRCLLVSEGYKAILIEVELGIDS